MSAVAAPAERTLGRVGRVAIVGILLAGSAAAAIDPFTLFFYLSYALVGSFLVIRRPANAIGWLLLVVALGFIGTTARPDMDVKALQAGTASARDFLLAWIGGWIGAANFLGFVFLAVLFPSGHLPMGRWRRWTIAFLAVGVFLVGLTATAPTITFNPDGVTDIVIANRLAVLPSVPPWSLVPPDGTMIGLVLVWLAIAAGAMVVRYRRSTGTVKLQLRWLVSAIVLVISAVAFGIGSIAILGPTHAWFAWLPASFAFPTIPLAIGVAILRYRLFDIDRIISRTIGYALVTATLAFIFVAAVLALQALLEPLTGGNTVAVAASTLIAAALFQPVRGRIQRAVDRRFDRAHYDGQRTAAAFAERLRDEVDISAATADLESTISDILSPSTLRLWLRGSHE